MMTDPWVPGVVIDVSKYQSALPSLTGVIGVIARAGIGTKPDPMFASHIANGKAAGRWTGSYWFNYGALTPSEQVDAYLAREKAVGGVALHVIDWEGAAGFTAAQTAEFIRIYQQRTKDEIGLYASESRFRDLGQDFNWIANYSQEPTKAWDMWQYGPFRGVDGNHAKQRILDLVKGDTMGPKIINLAAFSGTATVKVAGTSAIQMQDGELIPLPVGTPKPIAAKGKITPAWANHPSGDVYLIGDEAAVLLAEDITVVATPPVDCTAAVAAAKAAQKAADQAALDAAAKLHVEDQAALAAAPAKERDRIATAEANRIRAI